jgi:hypothetical protein
MIEVSAIALMGAAFTIVVPFLILIGTMFVWINRRLDRIEDRFDRIEDEIRGVHEELAKITVRVAVLEERGRPTAVTT